MAFDKTRIIVSDLHLGDGSRSDDFHKSDEFLKLLDIVEDEAAQLIIAGDLFELWQSDLERVAFQHSRIINRLLVLAKDGRLIYLIGNHDHIPFVKYLSQELNISLVYEDKDDRIWVEHGNQYNMFNRYKDPRMAVRNRIGRTVSCIIGWLERIIHPDFDEWAINALLKRRGLFLKNAALVKNKLTPSSKEYYIRGGDLSEYEAAALRLIGKGQRIVVFGHTHKPALKMLAGGIYANCGCWCGKSNPTYIKVKKDKIELVDGITHEVIDRA
ncbi:MAG: metallophosphoesterase [Candidatus Omnitrophica bacterium]|nr:metallophosphoesterase [Candidatus Omnitrophota bacterium]